ncbi:MAG: glycosyltransferase family 4 protein [Crocinitomicaceae bacterium]
MRCLYITSKPIYPIIDGGCFAMDSFLQTLQHAGFQVDHFAIATQKHPFDSKAYPEGLISESVEIDTSVKPLQALKFLLKKGSYNVERFHSEKVLDKINQMINSRPYDFIILDSLYATTYLYALRKMFSGKIFLRSHNCEAQIWYDLAENENNLPKSAYYKKLAKDLDKYEREVIKSVDGILAISQEDLELFKETTDQIKSCVIPVHVEPCEQINFSVKKDQIFHIGNMDWIPNREAVNRLVNIYEDCKKENNKLQLTIAGKNAEHYYESTKDIVVKGFVEDLRAFAQNSGILVSPIASSSGVRIKILEMMSYGIPVITTTAGARGIHPEGKEIIEILDSDIELGQAINKLSNDGERLEKMKNASQVYIRAHHNIEQIASDLKSFILD